MPKMTHRGTTKVNRNCNRICRAEEPSAQAKRGSALQTPEPVRRYIP
jgi:hypothetical protein